LIRLSSSRAYHPTPLTLSTYANLASQFAFWLRYVNIPIYSNKFRMLTISNRSSVVSVLFSLISETFLREFLRLSTFWIQQGPLSLLMPSLSVASIALPLADANTFSSVSSLVEGIGEESSAPVRVFHCEDGVSCCEHQHEGVTPLLNCWRT
jgi:hypothetical protein